MGVLIIVLIMIMLVLSVKVGIFIYFDLIFNNEDWELIRKNIGYLSGLVIVI